MHDSDSKSSAQHSPQIAKTAIKRNLISAPRENTWLLEIDGHVAGRAGFRWWNLAWRSFASEIWTNILVLVRVWIPKSPANSNLQNWASPVRRKATITRDRLKKRLFLGWFRFCISKSEILPSRRLAGVIYTGIWHFPHIFSTLWSRMSVQSMSAIRSSTVQEEARVSHYIDWTTLWDPWKKLEMHFQWFRDDFMMLNLAFHDVPRFECYFRFWTVFVDLVL